MAGSENERLQLSMADITSSERTLGSGRSRGEIIGILVCVAIAIPIPFLYPNAAFLGMLTVMFVWISVNSAWNIVLGFAGMLSFGQVAFFALGAYTTTILGFHLGWSPWLGTLAAAAVAGMASLLIGLAVIRLRGVYFALVTLAFHQLLSSLVATDYSGLTGGPLGLKASPYVLSNTLQGQAIVGYWIGLGLTIAVIIIILLVLRSPIGLALMAARDAEHIATARGVRITRYRITAFVLSGSIAGLMGAVYAHYIQVISPALFSFGLVISLLSMILVGGWGTVWGPVFGTIIITFLSQFLQGRIPQYQALILAAVLVLAVLLLPGGIANTVQLISGKIKTTWERME